MGELDLFKVVFVLYQEKLGGMLPNMQSFVKDRLIAYKKFMPLTKFSKSQLDD